MIPGALNHPHNGETNMNKSELIEAVAAKTEMTKAAAGRAVEAVLDSIAETVAKGDTVSVIGFGTFESRKRAARTGKNPQTGEALKIAATTVPAFKAGKAFKDRVASAAGKKGGKKK
jgi:DNA-binding protein HU-beta